MPRITKTALLPYSAQQMFDLVNDVKAYPIFVPGCSATTVIAQNDEKMKASIEVSKIGLTKTFITENTLVSGESIDMRLVDGPFKHLHGGWSFITLDSDACKIELNLEFEFKNIMVEMAFGKIFNEVVNSMVDAFTKRAKIIYGK